MIDIESDIVEAVASALEEEYHSADVSSVLNLTPEVPLSVFIEAIDNQVYERGIDSSGIENFVTTSFEVNVIAKTPAPKSAAKAVMAIVDSVLRENGLTRIMQRPVSLQDSVQYRLVSRYRCVTDGTTNYTR